MKKASSLNILFSQNLRKRRKSLHISQEKLGELSGLHRTYIGGIEQQLRNPSLESMEKIADALQIELSVLLSYDYDNIMSSDYAICSFNKGHYSFYPIMQECIDKDLKKTLDDLSV